MDSIRFIRSLFINGIIVMVILLGIFEAMTWGISSEAKLNFVNENGGALSYFILLVRNTILPESMTVFILALLMSWTHRWISSKLVHVSWEPLTLYQLSFLPVLLLAFVIFIPFTQSIRCLLVEFPDYSFNKFWYQYIVESYSLAMYFRYLLPTVLIGYGALNIAIANGVISSRSVTMQP